MSPTIPDAFADVLSVPEVQTRTFAGNGPFPTGERPDADRNIERIPLPSQDPVYGEQGPLVEHWDLRT